MPDITDEDLVALLRELPIKEPDNQTDQTVHTAIENPVFLYHSHFSKTIH